MTPVTEEVKARKGPVIAIACADDKNITEVADDVICVPDVEDYLQPLVAAIPLLPTVFSAAPDVRRLLPAVLLIAAAQQPVAGVVFVLDGVLIGAGDQDYLALAGLVAAARAGHQPVAGGPFRHAHPAGQVLPVAGHRRGPALTPTS